MDKKRKRYTYEEKAIILKRHLLEKEAISDLCDEIGIHPTMFYKWQRALFENAAATLAGEKGSHRRQEQRKIAALEAKLLVKNEVLAELMEEHIALKKTLRL
ncbi:MAG: transposase [Magnetococcales bacterium]|nr:transposase [Magnetococcales bacterium]